MKNTVFTKKMDTASKEALIKSVAALNSGPLKCDSVAIMEISGKPVYQLEVVALTKNRIHRYSRTTRIAS